MVRCERPALWWVSLACVLGPVLAARADAALFAEHTELLGSPQPCADTQEGCYSSYVVMADLDGDADLDIVFASGGGYYEPADAQVMAVYLNDGKAKFSEVSKTVTAGFKGRLRQVTVGDIDGDGDNDIIAPDGYGMQPDAVFVNDGKNPPKFTDEGKKRLGTSSRAGATRLGDLDGDADLDLIITDWGTAPPGSPGTAKAYRNDGHGVFKEIAKAVPQNTQDIGTGPIDSDLIDVDGDFDLDLLLASRQGESLLFKNKGDGTFANAKKDFPDQPGPYVYGPDSCDVDGDADLDVWLDNGGPDIQEQLVINDGHGVFKDESATRIQGNLSADDNEVQCVDLDDDGDLDAVVASLSDNERALINDGHGKFKAVTGVFPTVSDSTLGLDIGDMNGDGRLDVVTAQGEGGEFLNRIYLGTDAAKVDSKPPTIRAIEQKPAQRDGKLFIHFAVSDRATSDVGPRLSSAYVQVTGGAKIAATFAGGDLFVAQVPHQQGELRYRACAVDKMKHETCSDEQHLGEVESDAGVSDAGVSDAGTEQDSGVSEPHDAGHPQGHHPHHASSCVVAHPRHKSGLVLLFTVVCVFFSTRRARKRAI